MPTTPMNAGLPQQAASSAYRLGDVKLMTYAGAPIIVDADGSKWLRTGNLWPYAGEFSGLLKDQPGLLVTPFPARVSGFTQNTYAGLGSKLLSSSQVTQNMVIAGGTSGNWISTTIGSGLNLAYSNSGFNIQSVLGGLYGGFKHASANVVVFFGSPQASNPGACYTSNLGVAAAISGMPNNSTTFGVGGLSNSVLFITSQAQGASNIYTSTDGINWTARSGSGGNQLTLSSTVYCQAGACYLYTGTLTGASLPAGMNKTTDGFTMTAVTLPAAVGQLQCAFYSDTWDRKYAQSPTASIFVMQDGSLLRTTDGTNFSRIDLGAAGLPLPGSQSVIAYNSVAGRFVLFLSGTRTAAPMFLFSDDNGLTWFPSTAVEDFTAGQGLPDLRVVCMGPANDGSNKFVAMVTDTSGQTGVALFDMTNFGMRSPSYVGTGRPAYVSGSGLVPLPYYVKVK